MQYVFLIRSSAGGKKYVTRRMGQRPFLYLYHTTNQNQQQYMLQTDVYILNILPCSSDCIASNTPSSSCWTNKTANNVQYAYRPNTYI